MLLSTSLSVHVANMPMIGPPEEEILIIIDEVSRDDDDKIEKSCWREFLWYGPYVGSCMVLMLEVLVLGRIFEYEVCGILGGYKRSIHQSNADFDHNSIGTIYIH